MKPTQTHTPGPWSYGFTEKSGLFAEVYTLEKYPQANDSLRPLHLATVYTDGADDANARLIAAAPELLAALERFAEAMKQGSYPELQGIACDAFAAIARATAQP